MKKLLLFLFIITSIQLNAQALSSSEVDALMERAIKEFNVAGAAIAIVKDGKIVHSKGYGVRSIETKIPVDAQTNFQIASNSKAFTTAALAILVDEGKISWKDKVVKYIPEFKMYNSYVTENFMIEDLLSHRSGMGLGVGDLNSFPDGADFTINDVLSSFQYFKPVSAFRTQFDYDNQLYFVAGELIARVSKMPWDEFVKTKIMQPLQMNNSLATNKGINNKTNLALPHSTEGVDKKIRRIALYDEMINGAAGGILSNVEDMSKWMIMQLNQGKYGDKLDQKIFTEERQKEMWSIHSVIETYYEPRYRQHFGGYGLGWFLNDMNGNLIVSHTGGLPGMASKVTLIPDLNLGIVILTNTENGGGELFSALDLNIMDGYVGLPPMDYIKIYSDYSKSKGEKADAVSAKVWETVVAAKKVKINAQDYIGIYEDNWFGKIEVFLKGNQLWFKSYRSPKLNGPMQFYKANTFAIKWEYQDMNCDAFAMFNLDENGKAQSIKMKGISPNIDFSFDFQDLDLQRIGIKN